MKCPNRLAFRGPGIKLRRRRGACGYAGIREAPVGPSILGFGVLKLSPSILRKFDVSRACLQCLARIARTMERLLGQLFFRGSVLCVSVAVWRLIGDALRTQYLENLEIQCTHSIFGPEERERHIGCE